MAFDSTQGTRIYISATAPATYNVAGYDALTWTEIGEITDIGEIGGEWSKVEHKPVVGGIVKLKGQFDPGETTLQMALDTDDAGQILCKAALRAKGAYSFKVAAPENGDIYYYRARVMSWKINFGNADSVTAASMKVDISAEGGVDVVEKLAA